MCTDSKNALKVAKWGNSWKINYVYGLDCWLDDVKDTSYLDADMGVDEDPKNVSEARQRIL